MQRQHQEPAARPRRLRKAVVAVAGSLLFLFASSPAALAMPRYTVACTAAGETLTLETDSSLSAYIFTVNCLEGGGSVEMNPE